MLGPGEMAQQLRAPGALPGDPGSITNTQTAVHNHLKLLEAVLEDLIPTFGFPGHQAHT